MSISARLTELGIELPTVVAPVGAYVPAVQYGDLIYTSGQLPMINGELPATGKVGAGVEPDTALDLARVCAVNGLAAAADLAGGVDNLTAVVKVTGFVASAPEFTGQPGVINGASNVLGELFGTPHARSAVGVAALPLDAPVEVEFVFATK